MEDQKFENLLNLALDASESELQNSAQLREGYCENEKTWEVIIKYSGTLDTVRALGEDIKIYELLNHFAVIEMPKVKIAELGKLENIEYVELPKRIYFSILDAKVESCITVLQSRPGVSSSGGVKVPGAVMLSGRGILIGIVDSGIDIFHEDFRNEDGTSRILYVWDQENDVVYGKEQLDEVLETNNPQKIIFDSSGHGTSVAGICAGVGRGENGRYRGIAYESQLIVVKMASPSPEGFPRTTELMRGVDFCYRRADELRMPLTVNLSFGNNYGSHAGNSLVEQYLNDVSAMGRSLVVVGSGNEGSANIHTSVSLQERQTVPVEFSVGEYQSSFGLQIWKMYADEVELALITPTGRRIVIDTERMGTYRYQETGTKILIYYGEPSPFSIYQEIYFDFIPLESYVTAGIWQLELFPRRIVYGNVDLWLPARQSLSSGTGFLQPVEDITLTIPSAAEKVLTVGAYDGKNKTAASFSGRGFTWVQNQVKPDIVAPGVNIITTSLGGGYRPVTGTSFAAPIVSGAAALAMQWGIVNGNDPFLYGEKIKAYFQKGARPLPGFTEYPNPQVGWGALCLKDSLPV
ncbi:MAG: S8 family peptidase [Eubacterium sp.]|nr:S8 family peptidase [Eubacterium sp.]